MKKYLIAILILVLLSAGIFLIAPKECAEAQPCPQGYVLCCCDTWNGGTCCNCVVFCGNLIRGCFCK